MLKKVQKVGIVCYPTYGGSGVVATELGMSLAKLGFEIHFISYRRPARLGIFQSNVFYHEVPSFEYPLFEFKPFDTALASKIVEVCLSENIQILHVHYAIPHATIAFLVREILKTKNIYLPIITTLHGTDITLVGVDPSFYPVVEFSINQSDGVTAVSEALAAQTYLTFDIKNKIKVIPNFIDFDRFYRKREEGLRRSFAKDEEKILIHISNFRKVKRIDDILKVFAIVKSKIPSKLLLVGDGPERVALTIMAKELNIERDVIFTGKQDSVEDLLAVSDCFLLTSDHESFGLAALEAMACEVPVVSTNAGGLREVNEDGFSGFTCNVGDIQALSDAVLKIILDQETLNQFKKNAKVQAQKFDIKIVLKEYIDYYNEIYNVDN
ncbi:MAG TPA: N-acetyl-alpha-D-glucosaminyl L-malate synthase BshA [Saprospiraceae bacterium]|jgi:N-acetyl-alpha-D-glucosaminyl L-malate synthase BshA|nr:N-acetyl-alpha-D-glucosaminyl L-malate synthase BshA [Saprospiraceae bacterium]HUN16074.1 N-acetyl-alpha-D-glucosaminyl L-malate synthase BshA [Saprospiraceae bacterium]